jgi:hypothetical protein
MWHRVQGAGRKANYPNIKYISLNQIVGTEVR